MYFYWNRVLFYFINPCMNLLSNRIQHQVYSCFFHRCSPWNTFSIKRDRNGWSFLLLLSTLKGFGDTCQKSYSDLSLKMIFNTLSAHNWIRLLFNPVESKILETSLLVKGLAAQPLVIHFLHIGTKISSHFLFGGSDLPWGQISIVHLRMGESCAFSFVQRKNDVMRREGKEYSQSSGMFQENEFWGKNTMLGEDLETDFLKTALPRSVRWCTDPRLMVLDLFNMSRVIPGIYELFSKY